MNHALLSVSFQILKSSSSRKRDYIKEDLSALVRFVLANEGVRGQVELTLDLTNPRRIQALNRRYRGVDRNTDVIAFRYGTASPWEGDIAINVPQARLQAKKMRHPTWREIRLLLIHGILHLLGYTDYTPVPRRRMFKRQNELLRRWEKSAMGKAQ
jgi:probable rRNA maturation factor